MFWKANDDQTSVMETPLLAAEPSTTCVYFDYQVSTLRLIDVGYLVRTMEIPHDYCLLFLPRRAEQIISASIDYGFVNNYHADGLG